MTIQVANSPKINREVLLKKIDLFNMQNKDGIRIFKNPNGTDEYRIRSEVKPKFKMTVEIKVVQNRLVYLIKVRYSSVENEEQIRVWEKKLGQEIFEIYPK